MKSLLHQLQKDHPTIAFAAASRFYWSPKAQVVYYDPNKLDAPAQWALLHELSHGLLGHTNYKTDFELLQLEAAAWAKAKLLAKSYTIKIDEEHLQDCLDTYREWLHARSTCPACTEHGLQRDSREYTCINCGNEWLVSASRFCRPYRKQKTALTS